MLLHDPETGATAAIDAPEAAPVEAALEGKRLAAHRHSGHPSSRRPHRRHRRAEAEPPLPRRRARKARPPHSAHRRDRARRRRRAGRLPGGTRAGDAGTHRRATSAICSGRQACLRRRHVVLDRLRTRHRRHSGNDVAVAAQDARLCRTTRASTAATNIRRRTSASPRRSNRRTPRSTPASARSTSSSPQGSRPIPSTMGAEKAANPFLRADVPEVAKSVGLAGSPAWKVFAEIRERKN